MSCNDPMHDERNEGLWHRWRDSKGRGFASRCPQSIPTPAQKVQKAEEHQREEIKQVEDWWNKV